MIKSLKKDEPGNYIGNLLTESELHKFAKINSDNLVTFITSIPLYMEINEISLTYYFRIDEPISQSSYFDVIAGYYIDDGIKYRGVCFENNRSFLRFRKCKNNQPINIYVYHEK